MSEFLRPTGKSRYALPLAVLLILSLLLVACGDNPTATVPPATSPASASQTTQAAATTKAASTSTPVVVGSPASNATTAAGATPTATAAGASSGSVPKTTPQPGPTATLIPVPTVAGSQQAQQTLDQIAQQASKIRRLDIKTPVEKFFMTREALGKYQVESFNQENPPDQVVKNQKIGQIFGFFPKNFDLAKTYIDLLTEQILGFYDPRTKKFFIVVENDPTKVSPLAKWTTAHELTHALQDQHFDIQKVHPDRAPGSPEGNDDADTATLSLLEGDATLSQTLWLQAGNLSRQELNDLLTEIKSFSQDKLNNAPLLLRESLGFPYEQGLNFVQNLYNKGGWDAVNKAYTDYVPRSSSQILHPEKYDKRVDPVKVDLPTMVDTLGQGWKSVEINVMGEFQARIWLQGAMSQDEATKATDGWAGDRYQVVADGQDRYGYVWRSQWDSEAIATSFANAASTYVSKTYNFPGDAGSGPKRSWSSSAQEATVIQKGNQVLVVLLPKGSGIDKVTAKLGF